MAGAGMSENSGEKGRAGAIWSREPGVHPGAAAPCPDPTARFRAAALDPICALGAEEATQARWCTAVVSEGTPNSQGPHVHRNTRRAPSHRVLPRVFSSCVSTPFGITGRQLNY